MPRQLQPAFYDEVATATSALVAEDCQRRSGARSGSDCRDPTPLTRFSCCLLQNGNRETEAQGCSLDGNSCHSKSQIHGHFLFRPRIRSNMEPAKLKNGGGGFGGFGPDEVHTWCLSHVLPKAASVSKSIIHSFVRCARTCVVAVLDPGA